MKRITFVLLALMGITAMFANWDWAYSMGGNGQERSWDIGRDDMDNVFVAGEYVDSLVVGEEVYPGWGLADSFLIKYSPDGDMLWTMTWGADGEDVALGVDTDAQGNSYVSGYFMGTLSCMGQSAIAAGMWDVYVIKLDPFGNLVWLKTFGGALNEIGHGIAVNPDGRVYVCGWFADSIKLSQTISLTSFGGSDVMLIAMDTNGEVLWAKHGGTAGVEYGYKVACDNTGNAYITGSAGSGSSFDGELLTGSGMFAVKYSPQGQIDWLLSSQNAMVFSISVQPNGGTSQRGMVGGRFIGSGAIGDFSFSSVNGSDDIYWAEFDAVEGIWTSFHNYGGTGMDKGRDGDYDVHPAFVASFEGDVQFGAETFHSHGTADAVIGYGAWDEMAYTADGGENNETPMGIRILSDGRLAICGWHSGVTSFGDIDIDSGDVSDLNAFVAVYNPSGSSSEDPLAPPLSSLRTYPNPFTDELSIVSRSLPALPLKVYNLRGQELRCLEPVSSRDGKINYRWDGRDQAGRTCPSGIYLLRQGEESSIRILRMN